MSARGDFGLGLIVVGRVEVDATKFKALSGLFKAQAQASEGGISGTVKLFDVTSGDVELLSVPVTTDQPTDVQTGLALDYSIPRTLEVRAGLDGPGPYTDTQVLIVWFAQVELTTVF
jgi:hypothetical protein